MFVKKPKRIINCVKIVLIQIVTALLLLTSSCAYNHVPENNEHINLIWYNSPATQTPAEFKTGVAWLLSYLGAALPKSEFDRGVIISGQQVTLQIEHLGFSKSAMETLTSLIKVIKESDDYKKNEAIDAGRFFALCFNSTWHYYAITGAYPKFSDFKNSFTYAAAKQVALDTSSIASEGRLLRYLTNTNNLRQNFFTAEEGHGYFTSGNFLPSGTIEAFDYMENGQPRFAIYGSDGKLRANPESIFSNAGKPAKCMWCHESKMQPLFSPTPDITGYTSLAEFDTDQKNFNSFLTSFHNSSNSFLQFKNAQDHTQAEYIYLSFFEPSAARLGLEWGLNEAEVKLLLSGISTHTNPEFSFLTDVFYRHEVDKFAPYTVLQACEEARESNRFEPDYLP